MKAGEKVIINNKEYEYHTYYDRLCLPQNSIDKEAVACPKCSNTSFTISYGDYECIANCKCGHSMTIYDG